MIFHLLIVIIAMKNHVKFQNLVNVECTELQNHRTFLQQQLLLLTYSVFGCNIIGSSLSISEVSCMYVLYSIMTYYALNAIRPSLKESYNKKAEHTGSK